MVKYIYSAEANDKMNNHSPSNGRTSDKTSEAIQISTDEMLQKLADEMTQHVPGSYAILAPIKCHQLGEMPQDFYVDQWPGVNICIALLKPEYFSKFNTPPYNIIHIYSRTEDPEIIERMFNSIPVDWNKPIMLSPGSNRRQVAIISEIFRKHGGIPKTHEEPRKFYYTTGKIKLLSVPEGYEFVLLKPENVSEIFQSWGFANKPVTNQLPVSPIIGCLRDSPLSIVIQFTQFVADDIATLTERFPFGGIREKSSGKLIGYGGQLHCGTSGCNRVDPEHRGKKLFQVMISRSMAGCVERYGFATADILENNAPSIAAFKKLGFHEHEGHEVYWLYMHPSAMGPCPFSW